MKWVAEMTILPIKLDNSYRWVAYRKEKELFIV